MDIARHGQYKFIRIPESNLGQSTSARYYDGTTGGSTTLTTYAWYITTGGAGTKSATMIADGDSDKNSNSMRLSVESSAWVAASLVPSSPDVNYIRDVLIPVSPNTTYVAKWRFRSNYRSGDATRGAQVEFKCFDTDSATDTFKSSLIKTTTHWTDHTYEFTTEEDSAFLDIKLVLYGHEGDADLDMDAEWSDLKVYRKTPVERIAV